MSVKKKRFTLSIRLVGAGFFASLAFISLSAGLLFVNYRASRNNSPEYAPIVEVEGEKNTYTISILGSEIYLNGAALDDAEPYLERLSVFVPNALRIFLAGVRASEEAVRSMIL